jgi:class 3 adenylate cyclase
VTVLFADVKGSMELAEQVDPGPGAVTAPDSIGAGELQ